MYFYSFLMLGIWLIPFNVTTIHTRINLCVVSSYSYPNIAVIHSATTSHILLRIFTFGLAFSSHRKRSTFGRTRIKCIRTWDMNANNTTKRWICLVHWSTESVHTECAYLPSKFISFFHFSWQSVQRKQVSYSLLSYSPPLIILLSLFVSVLLPYFHCCIANLNIAVWRFC